MSTDFEHENEEKKINIMGVDDFYSYDSLMLVFQLVFMIVLLFFCMFIVVLVCRRNVVGDDEILLLNRIKI